MDINTSTLENPLAFFECILSRDGIAALRNEFIPTDDEIFYSGRSLAYDFFTEKKEQRFCDPNIGDELISVTYFKDFLYTRCTEEINKSFDLIDKKVLTIEKTDSIGVYINVLIESLKYLRKRILQNNEAVKYPGLQKFPDTLEILLSEKYNTYIEKYSKNDLSASPKITVSQEQHQITSDKINKGLDPNLGVFEKVKGNPNPGVFKWAKGDPTQLNIDFYNYFIENEMIETTLDTISKAFSGIDSDQPLNIKWLDISRNQSVNKVTLLYLFKLLCSQGLIETEFGSREMLSKLTYIFVDSDGNKLKYWIQSNSTLKKSEAKGARKTRSRKLIDTFILTICPTK